MDYTTAAVLIVCATLTAYLALVVTKTLERVAVHKATVLAQAEIDKGIGMAKVRAARGKKTPKKGDDDDENDIPPWIAAMAKGAGVDLEKVIEEDPAELAKVRKVLDSRIAAKGDGATADDYL